MTDKQAEESQDRKGYTKLINEYLEAKARIRLHPLASQILSVIERKTFGWHKVWDKISRRQYRESTGLTDWDVIRGIAILEFMKIIEVRREGRGRIAAYKIQNDFSRWKNLTVPVRLLTEKNYLSSTVRQVGCRGWCDKSVVVNGATYKRKVTKEIR